MLTHHLRRWINISQTLEQGFFPVFVTFIISDREVALLDGSKTDPTPSSDWLKFLCSFSTDITVIIMETFETKNTIRTEADLKKC